MKRGYPRSGGFPVVGEPDAIMMGYEYEIDPGDDRIGEGALEPTDKLPFKEAKILEENFVYCWEGLSYPVAGWEVKSFISSLRTHRPIVKAFLKNTKLNKYPNGQMNAGGIHINVSDTEFARKYRKPVFHFLHHQKNYNFLYKISHRSAKNFNTYCPQAGNGQDPDPYRKFSTITLHKARGKPGNGCYELRLFAAHPDLLMGSLEFTDAMFHYAATLKDGEEITPVDLADYTAINPQYKEASKLIHAAL